MNNVKICLKVLIVFRAFNADTHYIFPKLLIIIKISPGSKQQAALLPTATQLSCKTH